MPGSSGAVRRAVLAVGTAALVATVGGCGGGAGRGPVAAADGGSFSVGVPAWYVAHLTPARAGKSSVAEAVWTPLTRVDKDGRAVGAVAESIRSDDNRHWTVRLEEGWTFHNGEPVTAQSFADAWNAAAYGPNAMPYGYMFAAIDGYAALNPAEGRPTAKKLSGVDVVDAHTLRITLTKPLATFPYVLAGTVFAPMAKAAFKDLTAHDRRPIGNGPYRVAAPGLRPGVQEITLERYDGYAGPAGKAARIEVKSYQDDATAYTSFQAGAVDLALASGHRLARSQRTRPDSTEAAAVGGVSYLGFPLWDRRFTDPRVRRAFSLAIDRRSISRSLLQGLAEPAAGIAPDAVVGGGGRTCADCRYDPKEARRLLEEAGGWQGALTLWTEQDPLMQTVLEAVLNQLRSNLGIDRITIKAQPTEQLYPNLAQHKANGPFLLYMGAAYPALYAQAEQLFAAGSATNTTGYRGARFDALLDRAAARSGAAGSALARQAERAALKDLPLAPLYHPTTGAVHAENLTGVRLDALGDVRLPGIGIR
ncbi:peptide ABC transporter substrate-binding protein [Streptomyces triticagri]|uniref:peptide ABC transporter substrate-binding protein n=1 Tax=Streptomyces triticagri TaxID=2293568 RepID=UPI001313F47E|nr:ABC transporter substrate-binding protein [Streptomyces triticagri]